jgi:hypothetical protein
MGSHLSVNTSPVHYALVLISSTFFAQFFAQNFGAKKLEKSFRNDICTKKRVQNTLIKLTTVRTLKLNRKNWKRSKNKVC